LNIFSRKIEIYGSPPSQVAFFMQSVAAYVIPFTGGVLLVTPDVDSCLAASLNPEHSDPSLQ
jgi:hypothetical protein